MECNGRQFVAIALPTPFSLAITKRRGVRSSSTTASTGRSSPRGGGARQLPAHGPPAQQQWNPAYRPHLHRAEAGRYRPALLNARYYDPFLASSSRRIRWCRTRGRSSITIGSCSSGNPLKYTDPTGHYSDPALFEHFNCSDWSCVESHFMDGGSTAGLPGTAICTRPAR